MSYIEIVDKASSDMPKEKFMNKIGENESAQHTL